MGQAPPSPAPPGPAAAEEDEEAGPPMGAVMSEDLRQCTCISDPDLLRGTRVADVLWSCGRLLQDSAGTAETFSLSAPVTRIDEFISHNWSTRRMRKFMVLALHYNLGLAVSAASAAALLLFSLEAAGALPDYRYDTSGRGWLIDTGRKAPFCFLAGNLVLALTVPFGRQAVGRRALRGPSVFLDKACIHQTDPERKRRAITRLAGLLQQSDGVVVVYTSSYLRKVWTVYELASALMLQPAKRLVVFPVLLPWIALACASARMAKLLVCELLRIGWVEEALRGVQAAQLCGEGLARHALAELPTALHFAVLCGLLRLWANARARIDEAVQKFSVRDAACTEEADRELVQGNIALFMREFGYVEKGAPIERALDEFDALVRALLPGALRASFGRAGLPYRIVAAACGLPAIFDDLDRLASLARAGGSALQVGVTLLDALTYNLAVWPCTVGLASCLSSFLVPCPGPAAAALFPAQVAAALLAKRLASEVCALAVRAATTSAWGLRAYLCWAGLLWLLTGLFYYPQAWRRPGRPTPEASEEAEPSSCTSRGPPRRPGPKRPRAAEAAGHPAFFPACAAEAEPCPAPPAAAGPQAWRPPSGPLQKAGGEPEPSPCSSEGSPQLSGP